MKKKIVLAMAVIMVLGSVKAMAEEYSFEDLENQRTKIEAAEEMNARLDAEENEFETLNQLTKTYAAEADWKARQNADPVKEISKEIKGKISKIRSLKDKEQPALAGKIDATSADATSRCNQFVKANDLRSLQDLSSKLDDIWDQVNKMDERNNIRGLRVHEELRY